MRIGIIGTAGRREDGARITAKLYETVYEDCWKRIDELADEDDSLVLVSGGAAFADHLAVSHYLAGHCDELWLFLPAPFKEGKFVEAGFRSPGAIANYYHYKFSEVMGEDKGASLRGIATAIEKGAKIFVNEKGFKARNRQVARTVDFLIAYTFGSGESPKDGGTAHTFNLCEADKIHVPLAQFEG